MPLIAVLRVGSRQPLLCLATRGRGSGCCCRPSSSPWVHSSCSAGHRRRS